MDGLGAVLVTIFSGLTLVALLVGFRAIFPGVLSRTLRIADRMPGRSLVVGLVNLLFFGSIAVGFSAISEGLNARFFLLPALVLLGALGIGLLCGLSAMGNLAGERIFPDQGPWRQSAWGNALLVAGSLTPFVGWFIFFPYLALVGLGAFILGWFRRSEIENL